MSKVITFSRVFPAYHPRKGEKTFFPEKVLGGLIELGLCDSDTILRNNLDLNIFFIIDLNKNFKYHTIRAGNRWKVGDKFSPRVWSGKPYKSKQIIIAPDIEIKKTWDFHMDLNGVYSLNGKYLDHKKYFHLAKNDGLEVSDMFHWFMPNFDKPKEFTGQIISWNENIKY